MSIMSDVEMTVTVPKVSVGEYTNATTIGFPFPLLPVASDYFLLLLVSPARV